MAQKVREVIRWNIQLILLVTRAALIYPLNKKVIGGPGADAGVANIFLSKNSVAKGSMSRTGNEKRRVHRAQTEELRADNGPLLYSSRIINNYIEYLQEYYPDIDIDAILQYAAMSKQEVEDPGHWFSQQQADRFHEIVVAKTGNRDIPREAGRFSVSCKRIGAAKQYALGFVNPASIYLRIGKLAKTVSRGAVLTGKKLGGTKVEIISIPTPGTQEKLYQCENRIGLLESAGKIFTNKFAEIEHPSCFHRGDDCCRYIITWEKTPAIIWKQIRNAIFFTGLAAALVLFPIIPRESWNALLLTSSFLFFLFCSYAQWLEKKELIKTIETQGNAARDLMDEMNIRHSNALLIQETGQAISKILDVDRIIDTVVAGWKNTCISIAV